MKQRIIQLLGWTDLEYAEMQYTTGIDYLNAYIPGDVHGIDMLSRNKIYWNWWKNHWAIRDEQFVDEVQDAINKKTLQRLYMRRHSIENLIDEIFPNAQVLGSSYCKMIGRLIDTK